MLTQKILIVEDDKHILKLVKYNLEKAGFNCQTSITGEGALDILDKQPIDLIILDIMLPKMDGLETCKHIKQDPRLKNIPVIMLTAKGEEVDKIVHRLNEEISSKIDCKTCANCCNTVLPVLNEKDIEKLSKGLRIPIAQVNSKYLTKEEDEITFNKTPCPLLKDNLFSYYDSRPKDCVSYPHLHKEGFVFRLFGVIDNYSVCPIVFNVFERLKAEIWHYRHFDEFEEFDDFL